MPRLNREQQRQRAQVLKQQEEQLAWQEFVASYPARLLNLVYEYSQRPELSIQRDPASQDFLLSQPRVWQEHRFPSQLLEQNQDLIYAMRDAEWNLHVVQEAENRAEKQAQLRNQALNKLSAEERAALNL